MSKINLRWQLLLALSGFAFILALLSFQAQSASLCTVTVPASGGVFVEGVVGSPRYLNPLLSDVNPVDRDLTALLFDGLTRYDENGRLAPALARSWQVSDDGLTVTFILRDDVSWHDGQPVTANDVAFTYGLMQAEAFPGSPALHTLWQTVTIAVLDPLTVSFTLQEVYAPFLEATTRGILPQHVWAGVTAVSLPDAPFNLQPIGSGPFIVAADQSPQQDGRLRLLPNPSYWHGGTQLAGLEFRFFPDDQSLLAAFSAGSLHAVHRITPAWLPQVAATPEVRLFTAVQPRLTSLLFNLTESGTAAVQEKGVRQALAYALDRHRLIDVALQGQGVPVDGPYLPSSWAYNPGLLTHYTYAPETAVSLLVGAGWILPDGQTTRQQGEESLTLRLLLLDTPTNRQVAAFLVTEWQNVGVAVTETAVADLATWRQALSEREFDIALVDITPSADPDLYDFWSQEAIVNGQNYAGWNNRRASEALEQGRQYWSVAERQPFYDIFLRQYDEFLPALTLYQHVYTYGLSRAVHEAEIGRIDSPRDRYATLSDWFFLYRDITVLCATETPEE